MEKEIYEKLVAGDTVVFEQVFKETYKDAYLLAFSFMKKQADVEDVLQDSYIKMFNNISKLQDIVKFKSWFNQIIVNNCKNALKKSNRYTLNFSDINDEDIGADFEDSLVNEDETLNPEDVIDKAEITNIMAGIINTLPEEQALCLQMFYYQDMKINDIASALDISENTVKSRLRIAKNKVSAKVEEFEKKNNIKLHSISLITLFFKISVDNSDFPQLDFSKVVLPSVTAGAVGVSLTNTTTASAVASTTTSSTTAAVTSTVSKVAASAIAKKIVAVVLASGIAATGIGVGAKQAEKNAKVKNETTTVSEVPQTFKSIEEKDVVQKEIEKYSSDNYNESIMPKAAVKYKDNIYYSNISICSKDTGDYSNNYNLCKKDLNGNVQIIGNDICTSLLILYNNFLLYADSNNGGLYMVDLEKKFNPQKINKGVLLSGNYDGMNIGENLLDFKLQRNKIYYFASDVENPYENNDKCKLYCFDLNNKSTSIITTFNPNEAYYDLCVDGLYAAITSDETGEHETVFDENNNIISKCNKIDDEDNDAENQNDINSIFENDKYIVISDIDSETYQTNYYLLDKKNKTKSKINIDDSYSYTSCSNINIIDGTLYAFLYKTTYSGDESTREDTYKNIEIKL